MNDELRKDIIMENYLHPYNKEVPNNVSDYIKVNSNNESCIDNIDIYIKIVDDVIKDIKFMGEACAISTSATSIMIKLLLNKNIKEAHEIILNYENMINEQPYNKEILEEALVYDEIYKQANRRHCALLPYIGIKEAILKYENK